MNPCVDVEPHVRADVGQHAIRCVLKSYNLSFYEN